MRLFSPSLGQEIATDWRTVSASVSSGAETGLAFDRLPLTGWSSATHADALHTESLTFEMEALRQVNYLKLTPKTNDSGQVIGFPVNFSVEWASGGEWNYVQTFSHVPRPTDGSAFIVRLPLTVAANALRVTAGVLGDDLAGNYGFQVAEVSAGYDPAAGAMDHPITTGSASSVDGSSSAVTNAIDGNLSTTWSSTTHSTSASTEWFELQLRQRRTSNRELHQNSPAFQRPSTRFPR